MFYSKKLKKFKNIGHGFFNRDGGFSKGIYKSLNCGIGSDDKIALVRKNIDKVCKKIGCNKKNIILLNQIHKHYYHPRLKVKRRLVSLQKIFEFPTLYLV